MNVAASSAVWQSGSRLGDPPLVMADKLDVFRRAYADLTAADRECWAELTRHAASSNIFVHDWFMDAALASAGKTERPELLIVATEDGRWLGALPLISDSRFGRWPLKTWKLWSATNQFLLTPLVVPQYADAFWKAALRHLDTGVSGHGAFYCRLLAAKDEIDQALIARCEAEGRRFYILDTYDRAARLTDLPEDERQPVSKKSRRKLESRLRNLAKRLAEEHGELDFHLHSDSESPAVWIDAFLDLEQTGWKGRAGSALACDEHTQRLFRKTVSRGYEMGVANLATLKAGDRPVAMTCWFTVGQQGFGFKMAYDEALAPFAPGQLLMQRVAELVSSQPDLDFDTCSAPDSQNCKYLWPDRRELFDCVVAVGSPARRMQLRTVMALRSALHSSRAFAERLASSEKG